MNDAENESGFGLAEIKREGASIPYDRAPLGPDPSAAWGYRILWRMKRLRARLRTIAGAITGRDTGF
jgi:hypothetical protein